MGWHRINGVFPDKQSVSQKIQAKSDGPLQTLLRQSPFAQVRSSERRIACQQSSQTHLYPLLPPLCDRSMFYLDNAKRHLHAKHNNSIHKYGSI